MKYIVFSFLLLGLASCSFSNPLGKNPEGDTVSEINAGGVRISASWVSVSSESGNVSIGADGSVSVKDSSGSVSIGDGGVNVSSEDSRVSIGKDGVDVSSGKDAVSVGKDGVRVGTGIRIPTQETEDITKDPEVENITKDIDNILNDIGKEEK